MPKHAAMSRAILCVAIQVDLPMASLPTCAESPIPVGSSRFEDLDVDRDRRDAAVVDDQRDDLRLLLRLALEIDGIVGTVRSHEVPAVPHRPSVKREHL